MSADDNPQTYLTQTTTFFVTSAACSHAEQNQYAVGLLYALVINTVQVWSTLYDKHLQAKGRCGPMIYTELDDAASSFSAAAPMSL